MTERHSAASERLATEIELLEAMYPDQIQWNPKSRELRFEDEQKTLLELRLPETYPESGQPTVILATTGSKIDVRQSVADAVRGMKSQEGEEILDSLVQRFHDIATATASDSSQVPQQASKLSEAPDSLQTERAKVVAIWLHHLLATGKRKLALKSSSTTTTSSTARLSGISKPGYPGIMVFSGPTSLVDAHVAELKCQRWQAFQVRSEQEVSAQDAWRFVHGDGIVEVESMSEVVQGLVGKECQDEFLRAIKVR